VLLELRPWITCDKVHQRQSQHLTEAITWSVVALSGHNHSVIKEPSRSTTENEACQGFQLTGLLPDRHSRRHWQPPLPQTESRGDPEKVEGPPHFATQVGVSPAATQPSTPHRAERKPAAVSFERRKTYSCCRCPPLGEHPEEFNGLFADREQTSVDVRR
jgi:hypothetical protein